MPDEHAFFAQNIPEWSPWLKLIAKQETSGPVAGTLLVSMLRTSEEMPQRFAWKAEGKAG